MLNRVSLERESLRVAVSIAKDLNEVIGEDRRVQGSRLWIYVCIAEDTKE
jgi:hypothetical protein